MDDKFSLDKKDAVIQRACASGRSGVVWRWNLICLRRAMACVRYEIPDETLPANAFAALERWIEGGVAVRRHTFERHAKALLPGGGEGSYLNGTPYLKHRPKDGGDGAHFVIIGLARACDAAARQQADNAYISDECAIAANKAVPASGMENAGDGEAEGRWQLDALQMMLTPPLPRSPRISIEDSLAGRRRVIR